MRSAMPKWSSSLYLILIGVIFCIVLGWQGLLAMERSPIVSLSSHNSEYCILVIEGFKKQVLKKYPDARFEHYFLQRTEEENRKTIKEINEQKPALLLTLGSNATQVGLSSIPDVPLVAAMVLNEQVFVHSPRATGVLLCYPPEVRLQWVRRFFPGIDRIAILYNPEENSQLVAVMKKSAEQFGIEINAIPVATITDLPPALKSLGRKANMLLGIPDNTVYSNKTAKAVLLSSFRNHIAFVGLSSSWVRAGALFALTWDYMDLGRQCGVIAEKIFSGTKVSDIAPVTPEKVMYELNLKTADHLRLTLDPLLIQEAAEVYQ